MRASNLFSKTLVALTITGFVFSPFSVSAQSTKPDLRPPQQRMYEEATGSSGDNESNSNRGGIGSAATGGGTGGQSGGSGGGNTGGRSGGSSGGSGGGGNFQDASMEFSGEALTCSVQSLLSNILTSAIYSVLSEALADIAIPGLKVKVQDMSQEIKSYGLTIAGTAVPISPSLDAIAYCLMNSLITYIADATISWIQGGFQGNPVFVDDPGQFFQGIVDNEISNFIGALGGGALCQGVDIQLQIGLLQEATQNYGRQSSCSAQQAMQNVRSGNFLTTDLNAAYRDPRQLPINAYFAGADDLNSRISANLGVATIELDWNQGFLSFKDPDDPNRTVTPGQLIENQLSERLGFAEERLMLAEKFDQVITALVNSLVKIALNEVLESTGSSGQRNYGAYEQYYERAPGGDYRPYLPGGAAGN